MTDREYEFQKARIRKLTKKWVKPLGLNWWRIDFFYSRHKHNENDTYDYSPKDIKGHWVSAMDTRADPYYLTATITFYLPILESIDDDELEEYYVHELMHIFLRPMHEKKTAAQEELVATKLAQAFIWSLKRRGVNSNEDTIRYRKQNNKTGKQSKVVKTSRNTRGVTTKR